MLTDKDRLQMTALALARYNVMGRSEKPALIYDIKPIDTNNKTYVVPISGELFYIGGMRDRTVLPEGFVNIIAKNFSQERRDDSLIITYQQNIIAKRTVSIGEELNFEIKDISGAVILAEPGAELSNYVFLKSVSDDNGIITFSNPDNFRGYAYLSYILSYNTTSLKESEGSRLSYSILTNNEGVRGNALCLHDGLMTLETTTGLGQAWSAAIIGMSLVKGGNSVKSVEKIGVSVWTETIHDFTAGSKSFTATLNGYVIFVGAYRDADGFLLDGFTVLKSQTRVSAGTTQTAIIAYKQVTNNEVISYNSTDRFGGAFYETTTDLSTREFTSGIATRDEADITFPMVGTNRTMVGIVDFMYDTERVGIPNNEDLRYKKSDTSGRLTTFAAVDFIQRSSETISFPYSESETLVGDVQGIWVEFKI